MRFHLQAGRRESKDSAGKQGTSLAPGAVFSGPAMSEQKRPAINWMDVLGLLLLAGLAVLPPVFEIHKQLTLLAIGMVQVSEGWILARAPRRGAAYIVLLKIALATLLIDHTGEVGINSSYYPIFYLPVVTAAEYFSPWATLLWTALASAAYCSYLFDPALRDFEVTSESYTLLSMRILFFFLAAMVVNRFVVENRRQTRLYQELAETLAETNRKLEQARRSERLAALGQMSAGLAHEIRNPLGVIKGSAEMLHQKLGEGNPLASELAGYISSETNRLSALVTRFLDFARPLQMELAPQEVTTILERALQSVALARKDENGSVRVERQYESNLPPIPLDESLSEQAFVNLIQNAYDAMGPNGGTLRVTAARSNGASRDGVEVRIEDTGPGVPAELREQIFNPFVTTKKTGVGLGLSIVSRIIDGHHGSIRVESGGEGQRGARFVVFLPASAEAAAARAS